MHLTSRVRLASAAVLLGSLACAGEGTGPDNGTGYGDGTGNGNGGGAVSTLSGSVQPILTASCAVPGCHTGSAPPQDLDLSEGQTFTNTVNVPANETAQTTMLMRIRPEQPDSSYLVHKIQGTHVAAGGSGGRMPLSGCCLSTTQINTIRAWVTAGALNN